jgi:hypothetical protein
VGSWRMAPFSNTRLYFRILGDLSQTFPKSCEEFRLTVDGLEMFTGRIRGQWICQTCRKSLITNAIQRRTFRTSVLRRQTVEELPPGLILRAQKMALQHQELEQKVAAMTDYTPESVHIYKRISELSDISTNLKAFEQAKKVQPCPSEFFSDVRTCKNSRG